jgi:hypothetical protein
MRSDGEVPKRRVDSDEAAEVEDSGVEDDLLGDGSSNLREEVKLVNKRIMSSTKSGKF